VSSAAQASEARSDAQPSEEQASEARSDAKRSEGQASEARSDAKRSEGQAATPRPSPVRAWWSAIRPRTLGASLVPVAVGASLASAEGELRPAVALACALAALALQIGTNLVNDALDFLHRIDTPERLGPTRVTLAGWLSARAVLGGAGLAFAAALACGVYLVAVGGAPILWIGLASLLAAVGYSAGPFPLASHGLGELAAFVFFGVVAVAGSAYLHLDRLSGTALVASLPIAALVSAIMAVNNLRDIDTDLRSGKRTLAVRIGAPAARRMYAGLVASAYAGTLALAALLGSAWLLLPLASAPLALGAVRQLHQARGGPEFNLALARTARLHAVYGALLCVGLVAC
jgi:1,4-dihydroxy-2-naphthoate octaprenyltransferase